jgi:hypothetical protein
LNFVKCEQEHYIYKSFSGSIVVFLVIYVNDILLIGNNIFKLNVVNNSFLMKDFDEVAYILEIKIYRNRLKRLLDLSKNTYINKVLK